MERGNAFNFDVTIDVQCSKNVKIIPNYTIITNAFEFDQDTGQHEKSINPYTTDLGLDCDIESYQVVPEHSAITQPLC